MTRRPIERDTVLPVAPDDAWVALTEAGELSSWFGADVEVEVRPGGLATFAWPDGRLRRARIEGLNRPRRFAFRWLDDDMPGDGTAGSRVEFFLEPVPEGTKLTVVETPRVDARQEVSG